MASDSGHGFRLPIGDKFKDKPRKKKGKDGKKIYTKNSKLHIPLRETLQKKLQKRFSPALFPPSDLFCPFCPSPRRGDGTRRPNKKIVGSSGNVTRETLTFQLLAADPWFGSSVNIRIRPPRSRPVDVIRRVDLKDRCRLRTAPACRAAASQFIAIFSK